MQPFTAAPHHDVLILVVQLAVLLCAARGLAEVAQRLGQPSVVGEIVAGILLGPSGLSSPALPLGKWLMPQTEVQGYLLEVISLLGAMFLLLITGLETDLPLIRRHARSALSAAAGGIVVPFATGFVLGEWLPDSLLADPDQRVVFALFLATALSISAIPVIAKVLMDLNLMRRDIGQTIIAAGMTDDTVGWVLLSIVGGLATGEAVSAAAIAGAVGRVVAFMAISFTLGRWLVKRALDLVQDEIISPHRMLTLTMVCTFAWGAVAEGVGLEAVLGAFVMGIIFGQMPRLPEAIRDQLKAVALGIFAPIFFGVAGLKVNIGRLLQPRLLVLTALIILIATLGKVLGTYAGARFIARRDHWTALSFGAGLNARGAMEIIVASIGLHLHVLTQDTFSMIVVMAMATSLMAPAALRWVLERVEPGEEEIRRLRQEELTQGSLLARVHRVLLPVRLRDDGGAVRTIDAYLLQRLWPKSDLSITLLNVATSGERARTAQFLDELGALFPEREVVKKVVESSDAADAILDEAQKDYDLLVLGATERMRSDVLFTPLVDYLVRVAPCATLVVQGQASLRPDWSPRRILVPTNGTVTARRAAEIGFALAASGDEEVIILNVVSHDGTAYGRELRLGALERQLGSGYQIVQELCTLGDSLGVRTKAEVHLGAEPDRVILELAEKSGAQLIIIGTNVRPGSDRLFLGPRVERILHSATCPVVVVNAD